MRKNIDELDSFRHLITELYPSGIISIVSDTFSLWNILTVILPQLKDEILNRKGDPILDRVVIRPDSGLPEDIICGDRDAAPNTPAHKGAYRLLWEVFGGTTNKKGYKILNSKIGLIYGEAITLQRQKIILSRLEEMGFAASNLVFGVGSYALNMTSRDAIGLAMKATAIVVNGELKEIFKDPITDSGMKKSARGLLQVYENEQGRLCLKDRVTREEEEKSLLVPVFKNGELLVEHSLSEIRNRLWPNP